MTDLFRLDGKTALVTGASSGLGYHLSSVLASQGARVALAARRVDRLTAAVKEIESAGGKALAVPLDVGASCSFSHIVDQIEAALGPIDILINNAGSHVEQAITKSQPEDFDRMMNTNLRGPFFLTAEIGKRMIDRKIEGRIVNIASVSGLRASPNCAAYSVAKAGVIHMTKSMALEWARYGINVNAICPGFMDSEMSRAFAQSEAGLKVLSRLPRRRVGNPSDFDTMVLALVAPASRFTTGAIIAVDDAISVA
jgi:NAD(P)-dependent dehydrogenase (short-subunit alcohol dehydrogenase family)